MRILFLSQLLPLPLDAGPKIRAYYVLRHLVEAGHDVTLLCFVRDADRPADVDRLTALCGRVETVSITRTVIGNLWAGLRSAVSSTPFLIQRDQLPEMDRRLSDVLARQDFDAVHADQLWMAPYAARCTQAGVRVLDQHNAVFKVPARLARHHPHPIVKALLKKEADKLESFERATFDAFDRVVWVSADDRDSFPTRAGAHGTTHDVIPIAVDPCERQPVVRLQPFRVTFLGGMHWPPNAEGARWFAEQVWPRVARAVPEAVFTVIGKGSPRDLAVSSAGSRIVVTGYVGDLQAFLAETAVFVVPLLTGAGMRVKILDAWCWGIPVVSTSLGAEGIDASHGDNMLIADQSEDFASAVIAVLTDAALAGRVGANGRATVETLYDWRKVYRAWDRVYH